MNVYKFDIMNAILRLYGRVYDELYEDKYYPWPGNSLGVSPKAEPYEIERAGVDYYDEHVRSDEDLMALVRALVKQRSDPFSSDREVSALVWTLDELGVLD